MSFAGNAMKDKKHAQALDMLDQVIVLKPEFAEGWNRRATLYFNMKEYGKSIADIEQTLTLEPRHFGALAACHRLAFWSDRPVQGHYLSRLITIRIDKLLPVVPLGAMACS